MMNEGDEDDNKPAVDENAGPKISMGRIKKRPKKNDGKDAKKEGVAGGVAEFKRDTEAPDEMDNRGAEGFTE